MIKYGICAAILCFSSFLANTQSLGNNPNHQGWQIVKRNSFNLIFPKELNGKEHRAANLISHLKENHRPIGPKYKEVSLLLHNQTLEANGYVALTPFRSELFGCPPPDFRLLGTTNWIDLLSIHEYRHVLQYSNSLNGATKIGYWLFGESGWSLFQQLALPDWYFEGDAVLSETMFSRSGRGRIPAFTAQQRAIAFQDKTYSYHKIRNGSFKDLVPDHYRWGYTLLSHLQNEKGDRVMPKVLKDASSYKKVFYPFSRSLKEHSGYTTKSLYQDSWQASKKLWNEQVEGREFTQGNSITSGQLKTPTYYYFPQFDEGGNLYALKSTYTETDRIVRVDNDREKLVCFPGIGFDNYFHLGNQKMVWTEQAVNPRRNRAQYSNIILYDLIDSDKSQLTKKGKYFSPILSKNDSVVYAIKFNQNLTFSIERISLKNKQVTSLITFDQDGSISRLSESNNHELVFIKRKNNKIAIWKLNLKIKELIQLTPWTSHTIDEPRVIGDYVYYTASFNQVDNIYRSPLNGSQTIEQLTQSKLGAYHPTVNQKNQTLVYTEVIYNGYQLSEIPASAWLNRQLTITEPVDQRWQLNTTSDFKPTFLDSVPDSTFSSTEYRGIFRGVRLHSWPITASPSTQEINLWFDNYLNELSANIGGGFNLNEEASFYQARINYGKWFPVFSLYAQSNFRNFDFVNRNLRLERVSGKQSQMGVEVSVPLQWVKGNYFTSARPKIAYNMISLEPEQREATRKFYNFINSGLTFSFLRRTAIQNLAPRWGFRSNVEYSRSIKQLSNEKLQLNGRIYLPGLSANHSLQISGGYQFELLSNQFQQVDNFNYVRGFGAPLNDEFQRLSLDYSLPLFYPDWGFWGISYFKRIRSNFFFDYGQRKLNQFDFIGNYRSTGVELIFDNVWLNLANVSFGVRTTYLLTEDSTSPNNEWNGSIFIQTGF